MTTIIALIGPAGSGKSAAAAYLASRYGARRYSFAAPLKEIARRTLDLTTDQVYGSQEAKEAIDPRYGFSARWFLQRLGTEGVRAVLGADFWVEHTLRLIREDAPALAVVDDARFPNECARIRGHFVPSGLVWRLGPPPDRSSHDDGAHASEQGWRDAVCDAVYMPRARGLDGLHAFVDGECARVGISIPYHTQV